MLDQHRDATAPEQRLQEILLPYLQAVDAGEAPAREELYRRHPDLAADLQAYFADQDRLRLARRRCRRDRIGNDSGREPDAS
jgi:hypothetical protein